MHGIAVRAAVGRAAEGISRSKFSDLLAAPGALPLRISGVTVARRSLGVALLAPRSLPLLALAFALGCATAAPPPEAFVLAPISPAERELQTRVFATEDEAAALSACIAVLRRHGFAAEDQDHALGVIVAYKDTANPGGRARLRASIASQTAGEFGLEVQLRITFQRLAWNPRGRETLREAVREPSEYDGFFDEVAAELASPESSAQ